MKTTDETILEYIKSYKQSHGGNSPSYQEIAGGVGLKSRAVVQYHIQKLVAAGKLAPVENQHRAFILIDEVTVK